MINIKDYVKATINGPYTGLPHDCYGQVISLSNDGQFAIVSFGVGAPMKIKVSELTAQTYDEQQKEIRLKYLKSDLEFGPYSQYKESKGVGCIIHYMRGYGCKGYDSIIVGNGEVRYWGELVATYSWRGAIPIFNFRKVPDRSFNKTIEDWARNQELWLIHVFDSADSAALNEEKETAEDR